MIDQHKPLSPVEFWRCPNCQSPLISESKSMKCQHSHVFDKAKQGYCNLLLANQKAAKEPGDSLEMIDARRAFLNAGHFQPLVEQLVSVLNENSDINNQVSLLDLGCGEGYYLNAVSSGLSHYINHPVSAYGIDISKIANRRAAAYYKQAEFVVASSFNVPVLDNLVDIALCVFAPLSISELKRILKKPSGLLLRVSPGPRHLYQLKQAIYDEVQLHEVPECPEGFTRLAQKRFNYELHLGKGDFQQLITMTPLNWHGKDEGKQALLANEQTKIEVDFDIQLYKIRAA